MQSAKLFIMVAIVFLAITSVQATGSQSNRSFEQKKAAFQSWLTRDAEKVPVIVHIPSANQSAKQKRSKESSSAKKNRWREANRVFQAVQSKDLKASRKRRIREFSDPAFRSMMVDEAELNALLSNSEISVFPNRIYTVALNQSVPLIFSNQTSAGFDGSGQKVVVLDTGVDDTHSFLAGAVDTASAACFSNNEGNGFAGHMPASESLCPGAVAQAISTAAGKPCSSTIQGCEHGTQMAGIIAGSNMTQKGVATGAQIIPIQVFTKFNDFDVCNSLGLTDPCIGTVTEDVLAALIYVRDSLQSSSLAAVNISFGTSAAQQGQCTSALETVIDDIVAAGTAVIASSGNNGSSNSMTAPACIDGVISVASTTLSDQVSTFSNVSPNGVLDFFAPGEGINTSTLPANQFADVQDVAAGGTSASAAHVSGAWAVMKSKNSATSMAELKSALINTGVTVTGAAAGVTAPRINLQAALAQITEFVPNDEICFPVKASNGNLALICL